MIESNKKATRPTFQRFKKPDHIKDYPTGPSYTAGHLAEKNAGWRVFRPVLDVKQCIGCMRCYLLCPDGTVMKTDENTVEFDYDFCKGCGICSYECPKDAITMVKENR